MRVLHVLDHSLPQHSGYVFRTQAILAELRAMGIETLHLTSAKHPDSASEREDVDGYVFYRTLSRQSKLDRFPGFDQLRVVTSLRRRLDQLVRELRPDIIHAHSPCLNGMAAISIARKNRIPLLYELRASWEDAAVSHGTTTQGSLRYRLSRFLETWVARRAEHVVTICEGLKADLLSRGLSEDAVTVVGNAVDRELLEQLSADTPDTETDNLLQGRTVIGFFGSFYSYEGIDLLLDAVAGLMNRHPRILLLLLGAGPEDEALRARACELGIRNHVHFAGRVPHARVAAFYRRVDTFVFPRRSLRLTEIVTPLKPLEAMAAGALVVASDVGGHRELVEHGRTGLLFEAGNRDDLISVLDDALTRPDSVAAIREAAREHVTIHRTWPKVAAGYTPVYEALMNRSASTRASI